MNNSLKENFVVNVGNEARQIDFVHLPILYRDSWLGPNLPISIEQ